MYLVRPNKLNRWQLVWRETTYITQIYTVNKRCVLCPAVMKRKIKQLFFYYRALPWDTRGDRVNEKSIIYMNDSTHIKWWRNSYSRSSWMTRCKLNENFVVFVINNLTCARYFTYTRISTRFGLSARLFVIRLPSRLMIDSISSS